MKKYLLISAALLLSVVVIVSGSKGQTSDKNKKAKKKSITITINDSDTIINGKNFRNLSKEEKAEFFALEKERKASDRKMKSDMKELNKEMEKLSKQMIIIEDEHASSFDLEEDESRVVVRKSKAPHVPHPPHQSESLSSFPPIPELPEFAETSTFEFTTAPGEFRLHMDGERNEDAQVFTFNDGGKRTIIKMMQASPAELKKIGAAKTDEVKMYPNPVKDQLTLTFNFSETAPVTVNIYDLEGKQVKTETIKDYKAGNYEKIYSISEFENGSYLVEFVQKDKKIVRKIYINK